MAKKKYKVVFRITHDGKRFKPGDIVEMEPQQAAYLLSRGTLAEGKKDPVPPNAGLDKPVIGQTKKNENAAKQLTADPGSEPDPQEPTTDEQAAPIEGE